MGAAQPGYSEKRLDYRRRIPHTCHRDASPRGHRHSRELRHSGKPAELWLRTLEGPRQALYPAGATCRGKGLFT